MGVVRRRLDDERGSALPELAIAMLVFSVAILGVVGSMGLSMQLVGDSRQRSSGVGVATERLERIHDIPYERIATYETPQRPVPDDPDHPDHNVSADSSTYTLQDGTTEPLVVDADDGALAHFDDPITVGNTEFEVFQFVTSVDVDSPPDGVEDARRVTVVTRWKHPVQSGTTDRAVQSSVITPGTVTFTPSPTPSPTQTPPAPTPTPALDCAPGDDWFEAGTGTMDITSGSGAEAGFTGTTAIQVTLDPLDDERTKYAELQTTDVDGTVGGFFTAATWDLEDPEQRDEAGDLLPATVSWTIPEGDGTKKIEARFKTSETGECSQTLSQNITLDETDPEPPPTDLKASTCTLSASNRKVTLTWSSDVGSDDNWLGWRVYRSINSAPFESIATVSSTSVSDVSAKNHESVRYLVRTYDKAGNESEDSNILSFSKHSSEDSEC